METRLANLPPCLIGMEACVGAHHLSRRLTSLGHDARLMPAKYVRPYSRGQKNDFRDAEAIAEAVQRPTMKFVATKTAEQLDLQALHRVRERLVVGGTSHVAVSGAEAEALVTSPRPNVCGQTVLPARYTEISLVVRFSISGHLRCSKPLRSDSQEIPSHSPSSPSPLRVGMAGVSR